jgi:hypothetical protein
LAEKLLKSHNGSPQWDSEGILSMVQATGKRFQMKKVLHRVKWRLHQGTGHLHPKVLQKGVGREVSHLILECALLAAARASWIMQYKDHSTASMVA